MNSSLSSKLDRILAIDPMLLAIGALVFLVIGTYVGLWVVRRPQRGLLLIAALMPFDGLLLITPGQSVLALWKEPAVAFTLAATFVAPAAARRSVRAPGPGWWPALLAYTALGAASALVMGGTIGVWGFKVTYFYLLVPLILWRCPFTARDRDTLVTILMTTGIVTSVVGIAQQFVGYQALAGIGYEFNTAIRFSGNLLRSFSTFVQPFPFGMFVAMVLLVCLPVAMADPGRTRNLVFLLATPIVMTGMLTSVVRGAILQLLPGLILLVVWRFRGLLHAAVPVIIAVLALPATLATSFLSSNSLNIRATGWGDIFARAFSHPFGNGLGVTGAAAEKSLELGVDPRYLITEAGGGLYLPDNYYVLTLLQLGVLGLWLLLLVGGSILVTGVRVARVAEGDDRALAMGIVAMVVGAAATALVSTYLEIFPLDFYFWLLTGVLTCIQQSISTPSPSGPPGAASRPTAESSSAP